MNYYYELDTRSKKYFTQQWQWWCMPNCSPAEGGHMNHALHDEMFANSTRVFLENANAVYQIKPKWSIYRPYLDKGEFMLLKLKAKNLYKAYDNAW